MSIQRILRRVREIVRKNRASKQETVISMLNSQIRGWAYYHRSICARKAFEKVDHEIFKTLWNWAKRRHPNKGLFWIKDKYFKVRKGQQWCFDTLVKRKGKLQWHELFKASNVSIRYHRQIRSKSNPFDPTWFPYFKERFAKFKNLQILKNKPVVI